jgi:hypothetical protein
MTVKKTSQKQKPKAPKISKRDLWLKYYLDESNPSTFLNKTESARAAGYKASSNDSFRQIGCQNFTLLTEKITKWLDEVGLSEAALKQKLLYLLDARETKFQTLKGLIDDEDLAPGIKTLAKSKQSKSSPDGKFFYDEAESLIGIEVENLELQRRTLDMALKVRGSYAAEKHDHTVKGEIKHTHEQALNRALEQKAKIMEGKNHE